MVFNLSDNAEINNAIHQGKFPQALNRLQDLQLAGWKMLSDNYLQLKNAKIKEFYFNGFLFKVQHNPLRITSTTAVTDKNAVRNQKCFLCKENLFKEQSGIKSENGFIFLCNPFPIFNRHFTIVNAEHQPQRIRFNFRHLLKLTFLLSDEFTLIYNGPECGASAPDHLHFQAGEKFFMPLDNDFYQLVNEYGELIHENGNLKIYAVEDGLRRFISFESFSEVLLGEIFNKFYEYYSQISNSPEEPKMNIVTSHSSQEGFRIIIFMRKKHRSSHFYKNEILLSPAAIDLGGVCITPRLEDFEKIDKKILAEIFREVAPGKESFEYIKLKLKQIHSLR